MSRSNTEIISYINKYGFDIIQKYIEDKDVRIITYNSTSESLEYPDWVGVLRIDNYGILYVYKYFANSNTIRGIKIGNWKYYLSSEKNIDAGHYYMNLRFEVGSVTELNYS